MGHNNNNNNTWSKVLIIVGIVEIIIAIIAASGLGVNTLVTTDGTADVILKATDTVVDTLLIDVTMEIDEYYLRAERESTGEVDSTTYTYKEAYNRDCGDDAPASNTSLNCNLRYAVWQWTSAFTALGTIACVIVFITGVVLLVFTCCGESIRHCLCGDENNGKCKWCRCLFSCAIELMLIVLNLLVFILFAFSWAIILGLKYADMETVIEDVADSSLNDDSSSLRYSNFDFNSLDVGDSLWPLAVASFLALAVAIYLFFAWCCLCCRGSDDDKNKSKVENKQQPSQKVNNDNNSELV